MTHIFFINKKIILDRKWTKLIKRRDEYMHVNNLGKLKRRGKRGNNYGLRPALRLSCRYCFLVWLSRRSLRLISLMLPDDSMNFKPGLLLVSSRISFDLNPDVLAELEELAESHGFVRIRERCLGDWSGAETRGGGIDDGIDKLFIDEFTENDSALWCETSWWRRCCSCSCCKRWFWW